MKTNKNITESENTVSSNIDNLETRKILEIMLDDSAQAIKGITQSLHCIENIVTLSVKALNSNGRILYVGAGTSGRLGVLDASECNPTFGVSPDTVKGIIAGGNDALIKSIEGAEDNTDSVADLVKENSIKKNDIVIGISCSGGAPFVLEFLKQSKLQLSTTALLTFNDIDDIDYVDSTVRVIVGPEIITGSTRMKGGTATKIILNMITTATMIKLNKTYGNYMVDLRVMNKKLLKRAINIICSISNVNAEEAKSLLELANGYVKNAIAIKMLGVTYDRSCELLDKYNGSLRKVLNHKKK